jgi:hypothetical protein
VSTGGLVFLVANYFLLAHLNQEVKGIKLNFLNLLMVFNNLPLTNSSLKLTKKLSVFIILA